jgi:hypothetical protein
MATNLRVNRGVAASRDAICPELQSDNAQAVLKTSRLARMSRPCKASGSLT